MGMSCVKGMDSMADRDRWQKTIPALLEFELSQVVSLIHNMRREV